MEYLLERKVKINREPEFKSLYNWCLNEIDDNNKVIGRDLIPFAWRFWFTGTSLQVKTALTVERDFETDKSKAATSKTISGIFYSGVCFDGKNLRDEVDFSMFGTARTIKEFNVSISEAQSENEEVCWFTAFPSYESEDAEFRKVIENDYAGFDVYVHPEKFKELVQLVESRTINSVSLSVKNVDGVYAEWTPTIKTYSAKLLTSDIVIEGVGDTKFEGSKVSKVQEFNIYFNSQSSLTLKQNLPSIEFSKAFDSDLDDEFEEDKPHSFHSGIVQKSIDTYPLIQTINNLKVVLWFVFAALIFLLLK